MEVDEGFIVGIYNYCDRWCQACAFTSRCRVFADMALHEAADDPTLAAVVNAPPLPQDVPAPLPQWAQELIEELNEAAREPMSPEELRELLPKVSPKHQAIDERARAYCVRVHAWLVANDALSIDDPADPRAVIGWFHTLLPAEIYRALTGLARGWAWDRVWPADHDATAKVALLGIARSHAAWLAMVERGLTTMAGVEAFIGDLVWLGQELERVFPKALVCVRPGLDEPEEVAKLTTQN